MSEHGLPRTLLFKKLKNRRRNVLYIATNNKRDKKIGNRFRRTTIFSILLRRDSGIIAIAVTSRR